MKDRQPLRRSRPSGWLFLGISLSWYACFFKAEAQSSSTLRNGDYLIRDSLRLRDSLYIIPGSVTIRQKNGNSFEGQYQVSGKLLFITRIHSDSLPVNVQYRVLAYDPDLRVYAGDTAWLPAATAELPMSYKFSKSRPVMRQNPLDEVDYAGAFGRGLSFGNNQSLVLNSNINLQVNGKLGNDIEIHAAISDENIPLQADGNTQQLNEIDQVFIEIKRKNQSLLAGDQQLSPDGTYFMKYQKKYKGLRYSNEHQFGDGGRLSTQVHGSIARGNFKRQILEIQEGNQGPYRLTGTSNELFVIVLSGSEKVYLDGLLLARGLEQDYVMDYNRSEISFTSRRMLNRNSRVVVEFEYSNQSYLKSAWSLQSKYQQNDLTVQWNSYLEKDNKSSNILQDLSQEDIQILKDAGDQISQLKRPTLREIGQGSPADQVSYNLKDSLVSQVLYSGILVAASQANRGSHTAQFSYVGPGQGNYVLETGLFTNGRAYRWVAPDPVTKEKRGEYEPISSLSAPKQQSQHALRLEYTPQSGLFSRTELSLSDLDLNLYSTKDKKDDLGLAWKQELGLRKYLGAGDLSWTSTFGLERINRRFSYFEPFRNPEFNRDWSLNTGLPSTANELLWSARSQLKNKAVDVQYQYQHYGREQDYSGSRHSWNGQFHLKSTEISSYGSLAHQTQGLTEGTFFRPRLEVIQTLPFNGNHKLGFNLESEIHKQWLDRDEYLLGNSFAYHQLRSFLSGKVDGLNMNYRLSHIYRKDKGIDGQKFDDYFQANEWQFEQNWQLARNTLWAFTLSSRSLRFDKIVNPLSDKDTRSLVLRHSLNTRTRKDFIRFSQTLESGSGQEPALEYTYLRVNKGQGYYAWIDINGDSAIQVSEFDLAPFQDQGEYIRYAVTGNQFIRTRNHLFLQNLEIDPSRLSSNKGSLKWWQRFALVSNFNVGWKQTGDHGFRSPFHADSGLAGLQAQIRNQVFFNRNRPGFELQAGQLINQNKQLLTTGFENRDLIEYFFRSRLLIHSRVSLESYLAKQQQKSELEFFDQRNYSITSHTMEPRIQIQASTAMRLTLAFRQKWSHNRMGSEKSNAREVRLEGLSQPLNKWSVRSSCSLVGINYDGENNAWIEYSMLQGLRPGNNLLLSVNVDREIQKNTMLRLGYDGRKSEKSRFIQTGRVQVIASF